VHDSSLLRDLVVVAGVGLAITLLFRRLKMPAVIGFIATGVVIGPGGFGLVSEVATVRVLAEMGVVLLLFAVGLEFSVADLRALGTQSLRAGSLQIVLTALLIATVMIIGGLHPARAIFFGLLVSLSSTALLLKLLTDRAEITSASGRLTLGVLLFQDLALVPLTALTPLLARWADGGLAAGFDLGVTLRAGALLVAAALVIALAWRVVPWVMLNAHRSGSREVFLAATGFIVVGAAWLSQAAGYSLALGAFLAGLILASSDLRSQVIADVIPFRDTLSSLFFVSIGMLFDPRAALASPWTLIAATIGLVLLKTVAATAAGRFSGIPWLVAVPSALSLAHVGEFSFVLSQAGTRSGLLSPALEQTFLSAAVFSILLAPLLVARGHEWALRLAPAEAVKPPAPETPAGLHATAARVRHVVIAGYGLNGRNVARVLRASRIPHVVVDLGGEQIATCVADGSEGLVGNAAQPEILKAVGVPEARVLVLALSDPFTTRHACRLARGMNSGLFIMVRTRYVREMDGFYEAGANLVIPEEFETSIEIFSAVLRQYHVPPHLVEAQIEILRHERYSLLRGLKLPRSVVDQLDTLLAEGTTETLLVLQRSPGIGHTLQDLDLEGTNGRCSVIAVVRGGQRLNVDGGYRVEVGDTLVLAGSHAGIDEAVLRLTPALSL
jgi:CPA2 family monovalent cation:H+ antiporter-2